MARSSYKIFDNTYPHFLTCTVVEWYPLFKSPEITDIIISSLRFLLKEKRMTIHAYVIMHDHIHLIAKADDLGKEISRFKSYTARRIIDQLILDDRKDLLRIFEKAKPIYKKDSEFKVWQEGTHPQIILSESVMKQKIEYIHQNPVKVGYVEESINWQFSSAVNYSGLIGILDIDINW